MQEITTNQVTLLMVESTGIQEYIFGSNNLLQNIGASELVARSTTQWLVEALDRHRLSHNARWRQERGDLEIFDRSAPASEVAVEVIYAGGGNALLLFGPGQEQHVGPVIRTLTTRVLQEARGLTLLVDRCAFDWSTGVLAGQVSNLRGRIAAQKLNRRVSIPQPGLAVTVECVFSGLPAVAANRDDQPISAVVAHKLEAADAGKRRLHAVLSEVRQYGYEFVYDFDQFGEKGETSYLAVIHTDGNGMGKRLERLAAPYYTPARNADYARDLRRFSQSVKDKATSALQSTVHLLLNSRDREDCFGGVVPTPVRIDKNNERQEYLPFRPIVFGGDDVTFVCEGRLGLALAAHYLKAFSDPALPLSDGEPAFARAGVAVTGSHYPFARAYDLAEALCDSAKQAIKDNTLPGHAGATMLDWHFATSGMLLDLPALREREYKVPAGSLLMRPVWIDFEPQQRPSQYWSEWHTFCEVVQEFQSGKDWVGRRNKVKALRDALRGGPEAVKRFVASYAPPDSSGTGDSRAWLPPIPGWPDMDGQGWQGGKCGYFDAVEALDFFVALEKEPS